MKTQQDPVTGQPMRADREMIETKEFFRTSEFWILTLSTVVLVITTLASETFDEGNAWPVYAALAVSYMLSRGISKAGSAHPFRGRYLPGFESRGSYGYEQEGYLTQREPGVPGEPVRGEPIEEPVTRAPRRAY